MWEMPHVTAKAIMWLNKFLIDRFSSYKRKQENTLYDNDELEKRRRMINEHPEIVFCEPSEDELNHQR